MLNKLRILVLCLWKSHLVKLNINLQYDLTIFNGNWIVDGSDPIYPYSNDAFNENHMDATFHGLKTNSLSSLQFSYDLYYLYVNNSNLSTKNKNLNSRINKKWGTS